MHLLILVLLIAIGTAAALRGLVAFVNHERDVFDRSRSYRPTSGQAEGLGGEMKPAGSAQWEQGRARRSMPLP